MRIAWAGETYLLNAMIGLFCRLRKLWLSEIND